jgi:hypothetical protein
MRKYEKKNSKEAVYSSRREWARSPRALSSIVRATSLLEARRGLGKKHLRAVDKLEYLPVDILRSTECRGGSMVFSQVNTEDGYARVARARARWYKLEKENRRRQEG